MDIIENNTKEALSEDFWDRTALDLVRYAVIVLSQCHSPLTIENIERFVLSAPNEAEANAPDWQNSTYAGQRLQEAYHNVSTARNERDLKVAYNYFMKKHAKLNDRTRSSIEITLSSIVSKFLTGDTNELLCTHTTFTPEVLWDEGKIIILDIPISDFNKEGILIQGIIKHSVQRALLRRSLKVSPRPVALIQDEYQNFCSAFDYRFLSEARSAGVAVIMATQNIANLYSILGSGARDQANSLLGNAATKIFHANTDTTTNSYASELIGQEWQKMVSRSMKNDGKDASTSISRQIHARVLPSNFQTLLQGGKKNDWWVEAMIVQTGKGKWQSTGKSYHTARFKQEFE